MADVNFYKNAIQQLRKLDYDIVISVMSRGNLPEVVNKELGKAIVVGKHCKGSIAKKAYCNLRRVLALRKFINKIKPDVVTSFSYYPAAATFQKKIPSVVFHDDPEYKLQFRLCKFFADKLIIPDFISVKSKNIKKYHSYKEWAYLNPKYFKSNPLVLRKYNLIENKYVFIRDVASVSLNYQKNSTNYSEILDILRKKGLKIVVSLEDKSPEKEFKNCIILKEPVKDFYSLVYYSLALISSGDTMAREAALLGIPAFYIGKRDMAVNREFIAEKLMIDPNQISIKSFLRTLFRKTKQRSTNTIKSYSRNLEDTTKIIVNELTRK